MAGESPRSSWLRPEAQLIAAVLVLVGGGGWSHVTLSSSISSEIRAQGEKLDQIKNAVTELKVQVQTGERANAALTATQAALAGRVNALESRDAAHAEQLSELQRRVESLETTRTK